MNLPNASESEIQEVGGEPLERSGFENERPSIAFEPFEEAAEGGSAQ
jgi:hypothetical protein